MTPAQTPPVAESVEQIEQKMHDFLGVLGRFPSAGVVPYDAAVRAIAAAYEAGRAEGVRAGLDMAAFAALAEKVDADATGDGEDRAYNAACEHITGSIRALSKEPTK